MNHLIEQHSIKAESKNRAGGWRHILMVCAYGVFCVALIADSTIFCLLPIDSQIGAVMALIGIVLIASAWCFAKLAGPGDEKSSESLPAHGTTARNVGPIRLAGLTARHNLVKALGDLD